VSRPTDAIPRYADLPIDPGHPPRSAWGVFGDRDELGTLNLVGEEQVAHAASLVRRGAVYSLNWDLELPDPAILGRRTLRHTVIDLGVGTEDRYDSFYPQVSSQWDALCHIAHPVHGYYNGHTRAEITGRPGSRLGIDAFARRGIVGRFVLVDVARHLAEEGRTIDAGARTPIDVDDLEGALARQGVALCRGDILLLRVGWVGWYERQDRATRARLAALDLFPCPGLAAEERTAAWLWDNRVAAICSDNPALEAMPMDESSEQGFLHYRLIPLLGFAIGELLQLDALADDCAADGVWEGLFTAAPLNKVGGSGSTANALALR
jgi:kynurenine formamidase